MLCLENIKVRLHRCSNCYCLDSGTRNKIVNKQQITKRRRVRLKERWRLGRPRPRQG